MGATAISSIQVAKLIQMVPLLVKFYEISFWPANIKFFSKVALGANIAKFKGQRAPEKRNFFGQFKKKCLKTPVLTIFWNILCLRRTKILTK